MVRVRSQPRSPAGFPLIVYQPRARARCRDPKTPPRASRVSSRGLFSASENSLSPFLWMRKTRRRAPFYGAEKFKPGPRARWRVV